MAAIVDVEKYVQLDGYGGPVLVDADDPASAPLLLEADGDPQFLFEVTNTDDVPLSNVTLADDQFTADPLLVDDAYGGSFNVGDIDQDNVLDPGETWLYTATGTWEEGSQTDVATATGTFFDENGNPVTVEDTDAAYYFGVAEPDVTGPGVRTPGFWSQEKWQDFWDGDESVPDQAGQPGFAQGDIVLSSRTPTRLLIGDFDLDGVTGADEDTIFLSLDDARTILDASQKTLHDTQYVLGRDVVATWLNFLAGNPIEDGDASTTDPRDYIHDAIAWLKLTTGGSGNPMDPWAVPASSDEWNAGNAIHEALDEYNNFGTVNGVFYAPDADSFV